MKFAKLSGCALALVTAVTVTACGSSPNSADSAGPARSGSASAGSAPAPASAAPGSAAARTGTFSGVNGKHVGGTGTASGGTVVLSGFSSDAGPDLHIYLAHRPSENDLTSAVQLGTVSADQASQTLALGAVEPAKYSTVVIRCDKAKAVFGDAPLS